MHTQYVIDDLVVELDNKRFYRGTEEIVLPDLSARLFIKLIESAPNPVNSETLAIQVWQSNFVSDETIAQRIALHCSVKL